MEAPTSETATPPAEDTPDPAVGPPSPDRGENPMDAVLGVTALGAPLLAATVLAFASGGYFITSWGVAAVVLIGVLALAVLGGRGGVGGNAGAVSLGAWLALAVWQGVSAGWAEEPAASQQAMGQTALYAAAFALGLIGLRRSGWLPWLSAAVLFATWVPVSMAVAARLLPDSIGDDDFARLSWPITYWNGLGALAGFGLVLAIGIAGSARLDTSLRVAAAAVAPVFGLCLYFTLSRGAIVVVALMLIVLIAAAPGRLETVAAAVMGLGGTAILVILAEREGNLVALGGVLPEHAAEGRRVGLALLAIAALCAMATWALVGGSARLAGRNRRLTGAAVAVLAAVVIVGGWTTRGPDQNPVAWADQQFQSFKSFSSGERSDDSVATRLATAAGSGRWQNWDIAWQQWKDAPLAGTGAGDYRFEWNREREVNLDVVNAHSLYLEVMGESGLIGLLLLITPLGIALAVVVLVAVRRRDHPHARDIVVAACAAGVIAVHAAGDWDWQLPAITLPAMVLGAAALKAGVDALGWDRPAGWGVRVPLLVACAAAALLLLGQTGAAMLVDQARAEARDGRFEQALDHARDAQSLQANAPQPRLMEAYVLTDLGRHQEADEAFAAALARSPRDWSIMSDWAAALITRGDRAAARPLLRRAKVLNPFDERVAILEGQLSTPSS